MDFGKIGEELFGEISEKFDNFCSEVDEAIDCKLSAVGAHIKKFWSEIVKDKIPKSPENFVDAKEEEVTMFYDTRVPTAVVDDEKNDSNMCPIPEVNIGVSDDHLQREVLPSENAVMGMYNNSYADNKENCADEAKISSLFESISGSCVEWEVSRHVDTNTEVASDQEADDTVHSSKSDASGTENVTDLEDFYAEAEEINHLEWSTAGANSPLVTEGFMSTAQSRLANPELYEDYCWVNNSELPSIRGLENNSGTSKMKSVEANGNEHLEDQEHYISFAPTLPKADLIWQDEEFPENDWVVV
ncbi:hypothetical protein POM88_034870 [Heracleum sosnowskyi]|uniref:Uncharacterized protein n=1 Tax=Heracleum sosnowskyi TaxID=360622 RepID=A0AAD8ME12_9APIA|nr:hypothetical protein POM88_034870 [Heracleum sosnowskyi]